MITTTEHGEAMEITTVGSTLMEMGGYMVEVWEILSRLENLLKKVHQFHINRSHRDVSGNNGSFDWSSSTTNKLSAEDSLDDISRWLSKLSTLVDELKTTLEVIGMYFSFKISGEHDKFENMPFFSLIEDLQFDRNRSHRDVSGNNGSLDWSSSATKKLSAAAAVRRLLLSPTEYLLSGQNIPFNAAAGMGCRNQKLVIFRSIYGMTENGVNCVIIKKLVLPVEWLNNMHLQIDPATLFPNSKHRVISFNTGTVMCAAAADSDSDSDGTFTTDYSTRISLLMKFVMYACLFSGALLHLLPQRTISGGGGQISVIFKGLPVPAAFQSLFVMNIALALSAASGALLVGHHSRTLKTFYTYFAVIFFAAAGVVIVVICLSLS